MAFIANRLTHGHATLQLACRHCYTHKAKYQCLHRSIFRVLPLLLLEPFNDSTAVFTAISPQLLLHPFWNKTSRDYWNRFSYGPDVLLVTQPSVSKHWTVHKALTLTSGLASSFLYQHADSDRRATAALQCQYHSIYRKTTIRETTSSNTQY